MIHLHCHTHDSYLDSTNRPEDLAKKAKELGMSAVAITDHGNVSGAIDFYKACKKEGVKPILGCELYVCEDMANKDTDNRYDHLIVLAKNKAGYKNILKLSSIGFIDGFYYKPRVDFKTLMKHKEGLVISTACLGGEIPRMITSGASYNEVRNRLLKWKMNFPDFYLEVQSADNKEQEKVNKVLAQLAEDLALPLLATSDAHFLNKEDFDLHSIFIKISKDMENTFYKDCWFKTEQEVYDVLVEHIGHGKTSEAIINTHVVADICNVDLELGKSYLPDFKVPEEFADENDYLWHLIELGFESRAILNKSVDDIIDYMERAKYEFDIIKAKGFAGYFLHVRHILKICENHGILTGDGRGSADNSLVCFLVDITNVDSILYDLAFSRFLTLERKALPDVDMDIQGSRKQELVNLLKEEYGYANVAQICTFITLGAKNGIDAIGKVLGIPYMTTMEIKKSIPDLMSLKDALVNNSKLLEYQTKYPELFDYTLRLEGIKRGISIHAGGVVLCPSTMEMSDFTALALSKEKEQITQLEMHDIEEVGMVKIDVLGIITLDVIDTTLDLIGKDRHYLDVSTLNFKEPKVYEMIRSARTDGVFQLESAGMKDACVRVETYTMEDIIAILALYRPDTMRELEHFIRRKHGLEEITYVHPDMIPILEGTYGCLIYQEQIMKITQVFAGFSDAEADDFRKGIGKKKPELVKAQAEKFRARAIEEGYQEAVVNEIADILKKMGGYSFNKGHASGYAITCFKTGYLKALHPIEYMCSLMSHQRKETGATDYDKIGMYLTKCQEMGIKINNPDINISDATFTPNNGEISYGLSLIKGVGDGAIDNIIKNRLYSNFEDFMVVARRETGLTKTVVVSLIKSGCFDFSKVSRKDLLEKYGTMRFHAGSDKEKELKSITSKHIDAMLKAKVIKQSEVNDKDYCLNAMNIWKRQIHAKDWNEEVMAGDEYTWEFQTLNNHLKGDPFDGYELPTWSSVLDDEHGLFFATVVSITKKKVKKGRQIGKTMAYVELQTPEGLVQGTMFPDVWERLQERFTKGNLLVVKGKKQGTSCIVGGAKSFDEWKEDGE